MGSDSSPSATPRSFSAPVGFHLRGWDLLAGLLALLAFSPAILGRYGFSDDYTCLYWSQADHRALTDILLALGRPIQVPLLRGLLGWCHDIGRLGWPRLVAAVGMACTTALLCATARRLGFRPPLAFLLGVGLIAVPSTVVLGTWAAMFPATWAMLCSLGGGVILLGARTPFDRRAWVGALFVTVATCTYQPAGMAFWLIWLLWAVSPATRDLSWGRRARASGAFMAAMAVASVMALIALKAGARIIHSTQDRAKLTTDIAGKRKLLLYAWYRVSNPWSLQPHLKIAVIVAVGVIAGLLLVTRLPIRERLWRFGCVLAALVLGFTPSLFSAESWLTSRTLLAVMPILPICLLVIANELIDLTGGRVGSRALAMIAVLTGLFGAAWVASYVEGMIVQPQEAELALAREAIRSATQAPSLTVMPSVPADTLAGHVNYDEFGIPSTSRSWVPVPLTELIYREQHGVWYGRVHLHEPTDPRPIEDGAVLDFGALLKAAKQARAAQP